MTTYQLLEPLETAILISSLTSAGLYGLRIRSSPNHLRMISKSTSTALLSLLCAVKGKPSLLVAALGLGAVGDAFLAWPGEAAFLGGLGSFLMAHLLYIRLFARHGGGIELMMGEGWRQLLGVGLLALAPAMGLGLIPRAAPMLRLPIALYLVVSLGVLCAALTIRHGHTVTGAVLFALSDCLLGADEFLLPVNSKHHAWMQYAVWVLYYGGQLLIASGFVDDD